MMFKDTFCSSIYLFFKGIFVVVYYCVPSRRKENKSDKIFNYDKYLSRDYIREISSTSIHDQF